MNNLLEVKGLKKYFPIKKKGFLRRVVGYLKAVDDVSFSIAEGEKTGLIAKNGIGKTTLLNILTSNDSSDSGSIKYLPDRKYGYLSQTPVFKENQKIIEAVFNAENTTLQLFKEYESAIETNNSAEIERLSVILDNNKLWDYENRIRFLLG